MLARMQEVNRVSPSFCTAKWVQSTVYLMNGFTHSCHHPPTHKVPLAEIRQDPSALHNTKYKLEQRRQMLAGLRPKECQYCWNIEDLPQARISDRVYKSTDLEWSYPFLAEVQSAGATQKIAPTYLEVAFENTCNFKCAYCSPDISSKWMEEIREHGPYPTSRRTGSLDWIEKNGKSPISRTEHNPYIEAFWKWWPELYRSLKTFRITGGEPLLSQNTWKILDEIQRDPKPDLNLAINTNMDVPEQLISRLIEYHNAIAPRVRSFEIYTSAEAAGRAAEYIRFGMQYDRFLGNVRRFLRETRADSRINFMVTFNALSVTTFTKFLEDLWNLRVEFNEDDAANRVPMMISYLRWPPFLSCQILPAEIKRRYIGEIKDYANSRTRVTSPLKTGRFYLEEIDQIERLGDFMLLEPPELRRDRADFSLFCDEYDRRRGTDFRAVFPELMEWRENAQAFG